MMRSHPSPALSRRAVPAVTVAAVLLAGWSAVLLAASPPADAQEATTAAGGLVVAARTTDPADPRVVLTNHGGEPCQVATTSLGTVAVTRVSQGGASVAPILVDVNFGEAVEHYLAARLHPLAPGESLEVPLRVVPVGPTGHALETVVWSASTPPIGSLHPITLDQPIDLEFIYAVPAAAVEGAPLCAPAAGASGVDGSTGWPSWLVPAAAAVVLVLLALLVLILLLRRGRRVQARAVAAGVAATLLAAGLVGLEWSTATRPAHAVIVVADSLADAWAECSAVFQGPGGDPANILPTLEGDGVQVNIIPAGGDQTHHAAIGDDQHIIFWEPDDNHVYFGSGGAADPCTSLYHELYHAYESQRGELDRSNCVTSAGDSGIPISEVNATRAQNLLRAAMGLPERDHYGNSPLPTGDCLPPEEQPEPEEDPQCSGRGCGDSNGDPHLVTYDGTRYSFQAAGEFVASDDPQGGFQVQVRQEPIPGSRLVSVNTAVALDVAGDMVELRRGDRVPVLVVDGTVRSEPQVGLPGGGEARQVTTARGPVTLVTWPDGSSITARPISLWGLHLTVQPAEPRAGRLEGLLGDFDGDPANDVRPRGGDPLPLPPAFDSLYRTFADSWRIDATSSLFSYQAGTGPQTYHDPTFPDRNVTVAELPNRDWAAEICRRAGVTEAGALEACTLDVGVTGQPDFAAAARATQSFLDVYRPEGPGTLLTISRPGESDDLTFQGTAGEKIFVDVAWTNLPNRCGRLRLLDPEGRQLTSGCLINGQGYIDGTVLPETGEYTVRLDPGGDATGEARAWIVRVRDQEGPVTPDGPEVTADLDRPGTVARFTFQGRAGQKVFVDAPTATLRNQCSPLQLYGPDGRALATGCVINGRGYIDAVVLGEDGEHTLVVDPSGRRVGSVALRLTGAVDQAGTIAVGGPAVSATIGQPGAVARFTFSGTAGQRVRLDVASSTLSNQCPPLRILRPDGTVIGTGCVIGGAGEIAPVTLPETGEYTVVVDPRDRTVGQAQLLLRAA
jgi:hypothetical protein